MNEPDLNQFEQELRQLNPAAPPPELMARLVAIQPVPLSARETRSNSATTRPRQHDRQWADWRLLLRWLVPATALVVAIAFVWLRPPSGPGSATAPLVASAPPMLKADSVQLDEQLVDSFDAVGRLPGGEPVRFRYQRWMDQLVVRDDARGVVIEQRTPRVEVVPVRFETY